MTAAEIIETFVEVYTEHLRPLVEAGFAVGPHMGDENIIIIYKLSEDIALELCLDVRDVFVDTKIIRLPEAREPGVAAVSGGRIVRMYLWQILEGLKESLPALQKDLTEWKESREKAYNKVDRYLKALKMPESPAVVDLFRTDARFLATIMTKYRGAILAYSRAVLGIIVSS